MVIHALSLIGTASETARDTLIIAQPKQNKHSTVLHAADKRQGDVVQAIDCKSNGRHHTERHSNETAAQRLYKLRK